MTFDRCEPSDLPWWVSPSGPVITIRLTPKSSRDGIEGLTRLSDGRIVFTARVRAVPDKGKANAALTKLVAAWLDVPAGCVQITGGRTSRLKSVLVEGDVESLVQLLHRRMKALGE